MEIEIYRKAAKLQSQISVRKGQITTLTQMLSKTKCVIKQAELEKKIHENVLALSNLRKEFEQL